VAIQATIARPFRIKRGSKPVPPQRVRGESVSGDRVPENATEYTIPLARGTAGRLQSAREPTPRGHEPKGRVLGPGTEPPRLTVGRAVGSQEGGNRSRAYYR